MSDEIYICLDCETIHCGYNSLYHYSEDSGGFCMSCRSEAIELVEDEEEEDE